LTAVSLLRHQTRRKPPLSSRLECLTQAQAKEVDVGIVKHGFMVALHEDHLHAAIHDLFPA
jgi:hypothetical protein